MKQLYAIILIIASIQTWAQCPQAPCDNPIELNGALTNQNYNGSTCFAGGGTIQSSVNWNQWEYLNFISVSEINVNKLINFPGGAKKVWCSGSTVNFGSIFNMTDGDTLEIGDLCSVSIDQLIANNGSQGNYNVIRVGFGANLMVDGTQYFAGDTICTMNTSPPNPNHYVYVVSCTAVTPLPILMFKLTGNVLYWETTGDVVVQYSVNGKTWDSKYFTSQRKGSYEVNDDGYYRIISDGWVSQVEPYKKAYIKKEDQPIINVSGQKVKNVQYFNFYIQGGKKYIKLP